MSDGDIVTVSTFVYASFKEFGKMRLSTVHIGCKRFSQKLVRVLG